MTPLLRPRTPHLWRLWQVCIWGLSQELIPRKILGFQLENWANYDYFSTWPSSYALEPSTYDTLDQSVFERLVKRYYHAKFLASSSKIDRVMGILVYDSLFTHLNPPLTKLFGENLLSPPACASETMLSPLLQYEWSSSTPPAPQKFCIPPWDILAPSLRTPYC